jgi:hypothetical protein
VVGTVFAGLVVPLSPVARLLRVMEADPHHGLTAALAPPVGGLLALAAAGCAASLAAAHRH